jgi:hypothetical protein
MPDEHLTPALRDRLAKVLGLLGSAHDGECLSAARKAHEIVRAAGATWAQVICTSLPSPSKRAAQPDLFHDWPQQWEWAVAFCARHTDMLGQREATFIEQMRCSLRLPSPKQCTWLRDIATRLIAHGMTPYANATSKRRRRRR